MRGSIKSTLIALWLLLVATTVVYASVISGAAFRGKLVISNNDTVTINEYVTFDLDTAYLINNNMLAANASDCAVQQADGTDVSFMPGFEGNEWVAGVPSIGTYQELNYYLYTGNVTGGKVRYFPAAAGMTVNTVAALEPDGANFTAKITGWLDTSLVTATGNTTLSGDMLSMDDLQSFVAVQLVDGDETTNGFNTDLADPGAWMMIDFGAGNATSIDQWRYYVDGNNANAVWNIQGSTDNSSWVTVFTGLDVDGGAGWHTASWVNTTSYRYWRSLKTDAAVPGDFHTQLEVYIADKNVINKLAALQVFISSEGELTAQVPSATSNATSNTTIVSITSAEHEIHIVTDSNEVLIGLGIDNAPYTMLPDTDNLTLNLPLHHVDMNTAAPSSKDTNTLTATITGAVWSSTGRNFDGTNDIITIADDASIQNIFDDGGTVMVWIRAETAGEGATGTLFNKGDVLIMRLTELSGSTIRVRFFQNFSGNNANFKTAGRVINLNTWQLVSMTYDNGATANEPVWYINGVFSANTVQGVPTGTRDTDVGSDLDVGNNAATTETWDGDFGDYMLFNRILYPSEITQIYNATKWRYDGTVTGDSNTYFTYNVLPEGGIPSNANDWGFFENFAQPYMETANVTINGTLQGSWEWEYSDNFTDLSGNNHFGTPSFRTTDSSANVSANLTSFTVLNLQEAPPLVTAEFYTLITDTPDTPAHMYDTLDMNFFGAGVLQTWATNADMPLPIVVYTYAFGIAIIAGLAVFAFTRGASGNMKGSLLAQSLVSLVIMVYFTVAGDGVIPAWALLPFGIEAFACILFSKTSAPWG